mgnify:CR=1 FL=1
MKLEVLNITKKYNQRKVVNDVSFEINKGEIIGLLGPNGAGKTTSFYILVGLVNPNKGKVLLDGEDISKNPMYVRARKGISYLAQEPSIFRKMSVEDNILCVLEYLNNNKKENEEILNQLINEFGLSKIRKNRGDLLSGGERRRVEIARSIAVNPSFILLDEPFAGVDPIAIQDIQNMIKKLKDRNIGVLITDHNVRETLKIVDKVYIVNEGAIFFEGNPENAVEDERIKKFYLGSEFKL